MMGTLDAGVAAIRGYGDKFDQAMAIVEWVEETLAKADMPVEIHDKLEDAGMHLYAPKMELQADLDRAKELIDEARQLTFDVLAKMP